MDPYLSFRRTLVTLLAVLLLGIAAPSFLSSTPQEGAEEIPSAEMPLEIHTIGMRGGIARETVPAKAEIAA